MLRYIICALHCHFGVSISYEAKEENPILSQRSFVVIYPHFASSPRFAAACFFLLLATVLKAEEAECEDRSTDGSDDSGVESRNSRALMSPAWKEKRKHISQASCLW